MNCNQQNRIQQHKVSLLVAFWVFLAFSIWKKNSIPSFLIKWQRLSIEKKVQHFPGAVFMRSYLAQIYSVQLNLMGPNQNHTWAEESLKYSTTRAQHEKSQHKPQDTFLTSNSWKNSRGRSQGILNVSNCFCKSSDVICHIMSHIKTITTHFFQQKC